MKEEKEEKKEFALVVAEQYSVFKDSERVMMVLDDNMDDSDEMSRFSLERIKMPKAPGKSFIVINDEGKADEVKTFVGIVVHHQKVRAYWSGKYDGAGTPPDCSSNDFINGNGRIDGPDSLIETRSCKSCPWSQFGTATDEKGEPGGGQACNAYKVLFIMLPGAYLPVSLAVPASSIKEIERQFTHMSKNGMSCKSVVLEFSVETAKPNKWDVSLLKVKPLGKLSREQYLEIKKVGDNLKGSVGDLVSQFSDAPSE